MIHHENFTLPDVKFKALIRRQISSINKYSKIGVLRQYKCYERKCSEQIFISI